MNSQSILGGILTLLALGVAASGTTCLSLEELADGVWLHRGQHADIDVAARGDSANLGVIIGDNCVAVIDTGGAVATGAALAHAIDAVTDRPVCYVINTHVHFDHVLGNAAFNDPATHFVGQQHLAEAIRDSRDFFAESFAAELGGPAQQARVIGPDMLVEKTLELDLGGRVIVLSAAPTAHTMTDLTVYDQRSDILFAGDLLFRQRMPVLDGSLIGWIAWMESAMTQHYTVVVPGHGAPDRAWPEGGAAQYRYLNALLTQTRAAIAAGESLIDAKSTVAAVERKRWLLPDRAHGLNVSRAYRELEWE